MIKSLLTGTALAVALTGAALAQTSPSTTSPSAGASSTSSGASSSQPTVTQSGMKGSNIIGLDIKNPQNETIGEVEDVVVSADGKIEQVVVSVGGFLGIGAKNVAIDWNDLTMQQDVAMVSMTKDQLKAAPEFKSTRTRPTASDRPSDRPSGATGLSSPMGGGSTGGGAGTGSPSGGAATGSGSAR